MVWRDTLATCKTSDGPLFGTNFLANWGDEIWSPQPADEQAAAELHIQLVSRITTQRLGYSDGDEATALESVYKLFDQARNIISKNTGCRHVDALTWYVINTYVRPFTAKWHRLSKRGALDALDATDVFRTELAKVRRILSCFDDLLLEIRDGRKPPPWSADDDRGREAQIAADMAKKLKWGISETFGGVTKSDAQRINKAELAAVNARREHYALTAKEHAIGLALSGGGIRAATFSLGVLIALARRNVLYQFDYLSTVSGGGYLGSFLTTFLNSPGPSTTAVAPAVAPPATIPINAAATTPTPTQSIGLRKDELPFRRSEGEAEALRHIRHYSKYLTAGSVWERVTMTCAQLYGMMLNGLGLCYIAAVAAYIELFLRSVLSVDRFWSPIVFVALAVLALVSVGTPLALRLCRKAQKWTDSMIALPAVVLIALLAWKLLTYLHLVYHQLLPDSGSAIYAVGPASINTVAIITAAVIPLIAAVIVGLFGHLLAPLRLALTVVALLAAPFFFIGMELAAYEWFATSRTGVSIGLLAIATVIYFLSLDINFTSPHRLYRKKLGAAYLIQPAKNAEPGKPFNTDVSLLLSKATEMKRAPYHLINCALNVPASRNPAMQGRLTDFFLFSRAFCGSPLVGYTATADWEKLDQHIDVGTAMAISGGAVAPQMGLSAVGWLRFWLVILNARLSYWVRNPRKESAFAYAPGLFQLVAEMFGSMDENGHFLNVSDGGHIENLGVYELLRRRCKYIVAIDGEQDPKMTFHAFTTLQRLAFIDLGVTIDIDLDDLRLNARGLTRSHFSFCRIGYPASSRDSTPEYGYLLYLKLSLTGNEGEFIRRYRLDEPSFPHQPTADQFFTEAQFEAYRSLGEHVGDKLFLPAIVGDLAKSFDVRIEDWFLATGKSMLDA
jgi:hypothetical protein